MGSDTSLFWTISFDTCFRKILKNCLPKKFKKKTYLDTWVSVSPVPPTVAKYRMLYLADTVLPAPDSPASQCLHLNTTFFFFLISAQCDQIHAEANVAEPEPSYFGCSRSQAFRWAPVTTFGFKKIFYKTIFT